MRSSGSLHRRPPAARRSAGRRPRGHGSQKRTRKSTRSASGPGSSRSAPRLSARRFRRRERRRRRAYAYGFYAPCTYEAARTTVGACARDRGPRSHPPSPPSPHAHRQPYHSRGRDQWLSPSPLPHPSPPLMHRRTLIFAPQPNLSLTPYPRQDRAREEAREAAAAEAAAAAAAAAVAQFVHHGNSSLHEGTPPTHPQPLPQEAQGAPAHPRAQLSSPRAPACAARPSSAWPHLQTSRPPPPPPPGRPVPPPGRARSAYVPCA